MPQPRQEHPGRETFNVAVTTEAQHQFLPGSAENPKVNASKCCQSSRPVLYDRRRCDNVLYDNNGNAWLADSSSPANVLLQLQYPCCSTPAPQVYRTERYGQGNPPSLTTSCLKRQLQRELGFTESYVTSPGQRIFNVSINGTQVLTNFDIYAAAGGRNIRC